MKPIQMGSRTGKSIDEWAREVHALAVEKGWWQEDDSDEAVQVRVDLAAIALMHLELSKELELYREGKAGGNGVGQEDEEFDPYELLEQLSEEQVDILSRLALIHSEISEAVEAVIAGQLERIGGALGDQQPKPEGMVVELGDAVIRSMDLCGAYKLSIEEAIRLKHLYNKTRPFRHGGKKA